jgi:hypothetical protein
VEHQRGNHTAAETLAAEAVAEGGGAEAHLALGNARFKLGRWGEAAANYRAVLAIEPACVEARRNLDAAENRLRR